MSKNPSGASIRAAAPLTSRRASVGDFVCCVCGVDREDGIEAWRECDERDQPIEGVDALVFLGIGHRTCLKILTDHPRLYIEELGEPGAFPAICGPCANREGRRCTHSDLKANGGAGLRVDLTDPLRGAIICSRQGRLRAVRRAVGCAGLTPRTEAPS